MNSLPLCIVNLIVKTKKLHDQIQEWANATGVAGAPFDSYLTLRGLRTLNLRMNTHERNAMGLAKILSNNKLINIIVKEHPSGGLYNEKGKLDQIDIN
mgnify:CR=1 FL=1